MSEKILCVDDDPNILKSYERSLHKEFTIKTAEDGKNGLEMVRKQGPFSVVVSDLRMSEMDGIQFLTAVRKSAPETVRIMLTGHAELEATLAAVNEGHIFQFLTKPCPPESLAKAIHAGVKQYHLITSERVLLKKTLVGSVQVLSETLSLVNPAAFSRASRIKGYVRQMAIKLALPHTWQFDLAAMLSQIGCVTLPPELLEKVSSGGTLSNKEQQMFADHPRVAKDLLVKIPRLESIAKMIEKQQSISARDSTQAENPKEENPVVMGAQLLKVALDYDALVIRGASSRSALDNMRARQDKYPPLLLDAIGNTETKETEPVIKDVRVREVTPSMILDEDILSKSGSLLFTRGQQLTSSSIERLHNFAQMAGVVEPFRVIIPAEAA